jgi:Uma2 family endonuclease
MPMSATRTDWTVAMLDALEDDGQRYELVHGELFVTPSPMPPHQLVLGALYERLRRYVGRARFGEVLSSPLDVRFDDVTRNRVQPDLVVVRLIDGKLPAYPFHLGDIALAIEITSPSTARRDRTIKRDLYTRELRGTYWLVDHERRSVTVFSDAGDAGVELYDAVTFQMPGEREPLTIQLPEFFAEALQSC